MNYYDLIEHLEQQQDFSLRTFGPGMRTRGVIEHIRKQLAEIEEEPADLAEWIDVVLLALDGAWRAGHAPQEIAQALHDKLEKNKARKWPDWRTAAPDKAIEHVREWSMRVYLSGPMSGILEHNFPAFNAEAARLRGMGLEVVNPAEINPGGEKSWEECLRADIKALCDCDAIALLPGWEQSNGAHLELHIAHRLGLEIMSADQVTQRAYIWPLPVYQAAEEPDF